jgi:fatty acid amide hydrolase
MQMTIDKLRSLGHTIVNFEIPHQ